MALEAIPVPGGNGYINDFATGRLLRDAKLYEIGAGTSEIRRIADRAGDFREKQGRAWLINRVWLAADQCPLFPESDIDRHHLDVR